MLKPNKINLIARMKDDPIREATGRRRLRLLIPVAVVVFAVLAAELVYIFHIQAGLDAEYAELEAYLGNPQVTAAHSQALTDVRTRDAMAEEHRALEALFANLDSYPDYDRGLYRAVYDIAARCSVSIEGLTYSRESGQLVLACAAAEATAPARYVRELEGQSRVLAALYGGYSEGTMTVTFDRGALEEALDDLSEELDSLPEQVELPVYTFAVSCLISKGGA